MYLVLLNYEIIMTSNGFYNFENNSIFAPNLIVKRRGDDKSPLFIAQSDAKKGKRVVR